MVMPTDGNAKVHTAVLTKPDGSRVSAPVRRLNVSDLGIDSDYQRDLESDWISERVREGWIEAKSFGIVVSARGGRLLLIDGQHRVALARECGVTQVWAFVMDGLSKLEEADLFSQFQRHRRALRIWELFKADSTAQKAYALDISRTVHQVGFRIDKSHGPGVITAIGALVSIHKVGGTGLLLDTLTLIKRMWTLDDSMALRGQVMHGLALFLHRFQQEPQFQIERLEQVLPKTAPVVLIRKAQEIASQRSSATVAAANVGEALRDFYNRGLGPDRKLGTMRGKKLA